MEVSQQVQAEDIIILGIATIETIIHITMLLKKNSKNIKKVVVRKVAVKEVKDNKALNLSDVFPRLKTRNSRLTYQTHSVLLSNY